MEIQAVIKKIGKEVTDDGDMYTAQLQVKPLNTTKMRCNGSLSVEQDAPFDASWVHGKTVTITLGTAS